MATERRNIAIRILHKSVSKGSLGAGLAFMDIDSADCLASQNLQVPGHPTHRNLLKYIFSHGFPDKKRLTSSHPGLSSVFAFGQSLLLPACPS
eukprot:1151572-Pelagomonas_calceolata.AAC.10